MPTHKRVTVAGGKHIDIFDDYFPLVYRLFVSDFVFSSLYRIGWGDALGTERDHRDFHLHSIYTEEEFANLRFMEYVEKHEEMKAAFAGLPVDKVIVNLSTPSSIYRIHTHPEQRVALYYANINWEPIWFGETLFYSEDLSTVQFANPYVPGRLIVFDASIPHTLRPQSHVATSFRFTLAIVLGADGQGADICADQGVS